jgi:hypothetical protein
VGDVGDASVFVASAVAPNSAEVGGKGEVPATGRAAGHPAVSSENLAAVLGQAFFRMRSCKFRMPLLINATMKSNDYSSSNAVSTPPPPVDPSGPTILPLVPEIKQAGS